jgi:ABC-type glycerol-3-phosphate transport system permease component
MTNKKNNIFINTILLMITIILIYPTILAFFDSFKSVGDILTKPLSLFPSKFTFDAWENLFNTVPAIKWMINGFYISILGMIINIFICVPAAYIFARTKNKYIKSYFNFIVITVMMPLAAYIVPLYNVTSKLGLLNTYFSVAIPISESVFGVFYLTQSFKSIPIYYEEAALIDGCTQITSFFKIFIPLARNSIITVAIFTFIWKWNSFLWPLMVLNKTDMYPLTLGIATSVGNDISWMNSLMAGAVFTILPIIILYIFLNKYIIGNNVLSGMK